MSERGMIVLMWRAGLRIQEALTLAEGELDQRRGSVLGRLGKGGRGREVGMDARGWERLESWLPYGTASRSVRGCASSTARRVGGTGRRRGTRRAAAHRRSGGSAAPLCATSAPWRPRRRDGPRRRAVDRHPAPTRTRARRGHGKAIVATARKLAILFWCVLTRGEDYAHQQPSLTKKKLCRLEITAGAPKYATTSRGIRSRNDAIRQAERELAAQAEVSYKRLIEDQRAGAPAKKVGASATLERA